LDDLNETSTLLALVLERTRDDTVIVVDALGIAALPRNRSQVAERPRRLIITPNRQELEGLVDGRSDDDPERFVAQHYGLTVVSFGHVAGPDGEFWVDPTAVTGLGTSGAGDVLAGTAGGAGARCHDAIQAACWAALCHRTAATRLSETFAPVGYLARQLADEIAPTLAELTR
jgi:NAD(P)H-hydrate repair Nnr-like enzyme with NAD(P)H-hydrate dehydratase domain